MKNKKIIALLMVFVGAASVGALAACNTDNPPLEEEPPVVEQVQRTVTFESNGGTEVSSESVLTGGLISEPTAPVKYGYNLVGWYKDAACTQKWIFATDTVTGDLTLYALWEIKDATADSYFKFTELDDGTYAIGAAVGQTLPADVVLPTVHEEKSISAISASAFDGQSAIVSVYIPETYTSIGSMAFRNCSSLSLVQDAENIETIGVNAFYGTAWESAQSGSIYVGKSYYKYVGSMPANTELTIADGTVSIADSALAGQSNLVKVNLPDSLKYIGAGSFGGTQASSGTGLTEITIPDGVESIGNNAFRYSTNLATVVLGDNVKSIGNYAFAYTALSTFTYNTEAKLGNNIFQGVTVEGKLIVGDDITELPMGLITGWEGLVSLELGAGITQLPYQAFATLPNLKEIVADNITVIGQEAFSGTAIESFTISENVTSIGMYAFKDCTALKTVTINSDKISGLGTDFLLFDGCTALETVTIGDNVTAIADYLFSKFDNAATTLVFGANVTTIGQYAFNYANINTGTAGEFVIPDSVTAVNAYAFNGSSYTKLTVGEGVATINTRAFTFMNSLTTLVWNAVDAKNLTPTTSIFAYSTSKQVSPITTLTIGNKVEVLPDYFVAGGNATTCPNTTLTTVTIPASVKEIKQYAFRYCTALETVNGVENVVNLDRTAFDNTGFENTHIVSKDGLLYIHDNKTLYSVAGEITANFTLEVPEGIEVITSSAFRSVTGYANIVAVTLPSTLKEIGAYAFYYCSGIKGKITLPASLEKIGDYAFYSCNMVSEVDFSAVKNTLKYIGDYAFYQFGYKATDAVKMALEFGGLEYLGSYAFAYTNIDSISITSPSLTEIPAYAFANLKTSPTSVNIPNVVTVGDAWCTLTNCTSLTAPKLTKVGSYGLRSLKDDTFDLTQIKYFGDNALNSISRETVTLNADYYGKKLFGSYTVSSSSTTVSGTCASLKEVTIKGDWTEITDGMFAGCPVLEKVTFESGITSIGAYAFFTCPSIGAIDFSKVVSIGEYAFCSSSVTDVEFGDDLETIGTYAFNNCNAIAGELVLGQKLKTVAQWVFSGCQGITKVTIGGNITAIEGAAFRGCSALKEIIIGEGVTSVEGIQEVAAGCKVTLPSTVINVGMCSAAIIEFTAFIEPALQMNGSSINTTYFNPSALVCKDADYQKFVESSIWSSLSARIVKTSEIVNDSVSGLWYINGSGAVVYYTGSKTSIVLPKEAKSFSLSTVIGTANFANVASFTLGEGVTEFVQVDGAIYNRDKTQLIYYPIYLTATTFTAPDTVTSVGSYAFYKNAVLISVSLPNVETIGSYAFQGCAELTTVTGSKLTTIDNYAFGSTSAAAASAKLATIDLSKVTTIGMGAFRYCTSLTSVNLESLTTISGTYAFGGCTALTTVVIGENFTEFKNYTFTACTALQSITIKATTPPTGTTNMFGTATAFAKYNNNQGAKIYVPAASVDAYKAATGWSVYAAYIEAIPTESNG